MRTQNFIIMFLEQQAIYKINGNWTGNNTSVYLQQAANDLTKCTDENLVSSKLTAPSKESEKLYLHIKGVTYSAGGYIQNDKKWFDAAVDCYQAWLGGENSDYSFAGIKAVTYAGQALKISMGKQ